MPKIHGRNGLLYLQGAGAEAVQYSQLADYTLNIDFDTIEAPSMGDTWSNKVKGLLRWTGDLNGQYDPSNTTHWDALLQSTSRKFYLYVDKTTPTQYYYGFVFPKLSIKGGATAMVTVSGGLEGDGTIYKNP